MKKERSKAPAKKEKAKKVTMSMFLAQLLGGRPKDYKLRGIYGRT